MDLQLYPYQQECIDHAKERNTIVHIPTGRGKTLVAARLIDHYLNCRPDEKIAFLVPTRALVDQQSTYLKKHCQVSGSPPAIQRFVGEEQADWLESDWRECMKSNIFVGTAALFQQVFVTHKYIDIRRFSLFVFDECHNATGNSPMAAVLRDSVAPYYKARGLGSPLRILGLTASFDNGNSQNLEKKKRDLEALMQSTIFCPNVTARIVDERFHFVKWKRNEDVDHHKQAIQDHVQVALLSVAEIKDIKKVVSRCSHVFEELGTWALFYYVEFVIIDQLLTKAKLHAERVQDEPSMRHSARIQSSLPALRSELSTLSGKLETVPVLQPADRKSKKLERLIELIEEIFDKNGDFYRGIVFVEQVCLVSCLAKQLNDEFQSSRRLNFGAVAGTGYQTECDRQNQLEYVRLVFR